jgi:polar amino acid transport system substrate-binding protein
MRTTIGVSVRAILPLLLGILAACSQPGRITTLSQLSEQEFAVPAGTVADKLVLSRFPRAKFKYFATVQDAGMAVKTGNTIAAAYDEPILRNFAAKNGGLTVLSDLITRDSYGVAVQPDRRELKAAIDRVITELKGNGTYRDMEQRWLPTVGSPAGMPTIPLKGGGGTLKLGTAAITEPFSFLDAGQNIVGFDIELARYVARQLGKELEIVNMNFGSLIPALLDGQVDMIAACITITDERSRMVLFSEPYYTGGIAALVRQ